MMMRRFLLALALLGSTAPASAAVTATFYAREFGNYFPHAFIIVSGHPDSDPRPADGSYGFTATSISPAILAGAVKGAVEPVSGSYSVGSEREFSIQLTDEQYRRVLSTIAAYTNAPQPSYDLHKHNCVTFIADVAQQIGLRVNDYKKFYMKPKSFLVQVRNDNPILGNGTTVARGDALLPSSPAPRASASAAAPMFRGPAVTSRTAPTPPALPLTPVQAAKLRASGGSYGATPGN